MPLISVIIPTFNRREWLARAVSSVLAQSYRDFELIVIDDGSTDGTRELVRDWTSSGSSAIRYLVQPNRGVSAARNLGIREARGELVSFLDSDDAWDPYKLEIQARFFQEHPDAMIAQTEEIWIRNGRRVNPMKKHKKHSGWIYRECLPLCIVSPSAIMMRRALFDTVGFFDESLPACEDYDLWLRVAARFPIWLIDKPLTIKYGGHADQLSRTTVALDQYRIQALEKILGSGLLNEDERAWTLQELERKKAIYETGRAKRASILPR